MLGLRKLFPFRLWSKQMPMTIRLRLTLWYSALLMVIVAVLGIAVFTVLQSTMRSQVDKTLIDTIRDIKQDLVGTVIVRDDGRPMLFTPTYPQLSSLRTPNIYVQFWRVDEPDFPVNLSANLSLFNTPLDADALRQEEEVHRNVTIQGTNFRVITHPIKANGYTVGYIQAAQSMETINEATKQLLKIMLVGGGVALLASLLLGDWLARRALRPISTITATAEQIIKAEDLDSRIPYHGPQDELGYLITTLNDMINRLEKLFTSQQRFVADVSHELRTPLTAIQSHVDLIKRYGLKLDEGEDPSLRVVRSETERMSRLVGDLLMLAQADLGYLPFIEGTVQLDTLFLEVFNQAVILSKGTIKVELVDIDQVAVIGDNDRLKQLLLNLVTNAIKYTPEKGTLKMSLGRVGDVAEIRVCDTGIGIPSEDLPHIFDRFYRVDKARARAQGGAGLGLAIAKWIADAHHGELTVESTVGEGTTFILHLPIKEDKGNGNPKDFAVETRPRFPRIRLKRNDHEEQTQE